jgi:hypothetical protein
MFRVRGRSVPGSGLRRAKPPMWHLTTRIEPAQCGDGPLTPDDECPTTAENAQELDPDEDHGDASPKAVALELRPAGRIGSSNAARHAV